MEFTNFVRVPFAVEACQITEENLEEMAAILGVVKTKGNERYIGLNRNVVPNISKAYVGWWVTRFGDNLRCYNPKVFAEQFMPMNDDGRHTWVFSDAPDEEAVEDAADGYTGEVINDPAEIKNHLTEVVVTGSVD